jgi:hypothetical protein
MESGGESFKRLWDNSDQESRNVHGRTPSGLFRFLPQNPKTPGITANLLKEMNNPLQPPKIKFADLDDPTIK